MMCEQGRSTLVAGEDGRILDRLAGLERLSLRSWFGKYCRPRSA
jgi:hypothetical protein